MIRRLAVMTVAALIPASAAHAQVEGRVLDANGGVAIEVSIEVHDGQQVIYTTTALSGRRRNTPLSNPCCTNSLPNLYVSLSYCV